MSLHSRISSLLKDRRAELWVCQRYDLLEGKDPHDYAVPASDASLLYRLDTNPTDEGLGGLYWGAVWLEGANSPVLRAIRSQSEQAVRRPVILAGDADVQADVSTQTFLPIHVLPGRLDSGAPEATKYGQMGRRPRETVAWGLSQRVVDFPGTLLVVVGASKAEDLERLWDTLSETPVRDLTVLVQWEGAQDALPPVDKLPVDVQVQLGTADGLLRTLVEAGAQPAHSLPERTIRLGSESLRLTAEDLRFIQRRFAVVLESAFAAPRALEPADLETFFDNAPDFWGMFASGVLPIPRAYRTDEGLTLADDVERSLARLKTASQRTFVYRMPCDAASGGTTLMREAAFRCAQAGYPTMVARSEQVEIDLEDVLSFVTALGNAAAATGLHGLPPVLVILDREHTSLNPALARQAAQALSAQGRKAVILQAIGTEDERDEAADFEPHRSDSWATLPRLTPSIDPAELSECTSRFGQLFNDWGLGGGVLGSEDWASYSRSTAHSGPNGQIEGEDLFWVAIRFFVCEGPAFIEQGSVRSSLAKWISKRTEQLASEAARRLVNSVAVLSSFRLVSPMMTVLRPVAGGAFSSEVVQTLRSLRDVVAWADYSSDLEDQVLTFRHPAIADEYLRSIGAETEDQRMQVLRPVIEALSAGSRADIWLAEALSATVLSPEQPDRYTDWDWRLTAFDWIPPTIAETSKAVLHHRGRCLRLSSLSPYLPSDQKIRRLKAAVESLDSALALERRPGRDEHPGHMYNTLGVVYTDLAIQLEREGDAEGSEAAWEGACNSFEKSIEMMPGDNVIAYLAFSLRLLKHSGVWGGDGTATPENAAAVAEVARAVSLLDEAEDAMSGMAAPDPSWRSELVRYKATAFRALGGEVAADYIAQLKSSDTPGLGYYCEVRLDLGTNPSTSGIERAVLKLLDAQNAGIELGQEGLRLLIGLMTRSATYQNDFATQRALYRQLEMTSRAGLNTIDMFRVAVLCYQLGDFAEGGERFRRIRDVVRQAQASHAPKRVSDYLKDSEGTQVVTQVRVENAPSDWRGEGFVEAINQTVPLRPRHFNPLARVGDIRECAVKFEIWGPLAVPARRDRPND